MSWDTVEGGGLLGSDGPVKVTIDNAYFGYDAGYQSGEQLLFILEGSTPDSDDPITQFYSVGNGWDTDDGKVVTGRDSFINSCNYARFFTAAVKVDADTVMALGDPADATIWKGQSFMMERVGFKMTFKSEGEKEFFVFIPVGKAKKDKKSKKGGKGKASSSSEKKGGKSLRGKVKKMADKYDDHDDFLAAVLDKYPEVEDDDDLYEDVLEEDGIFEEVNG
ncbi:hypothetical protein DRQ53_14105 [bacterium]|nr:MAG: hypothetical protein DRQ53_14105 [bacterium]